MMTVTPMFSHFSKVLFVLVSSIFVMPTLAAKLSNYDCSFALSEGMQSIRSVTLTEDLYRCFQFDNYADLGVVNADHQLVPFMLRAPAVNVSRKRYTKDIAFYQEPQVSSYRTGDQIRRIAALTGVVSNNISDKQWQQTNVHYSSIILKQAERNSDQYGDKLLSIVLDVNTSEEPILATMLIEVSNDLQHWQTLSKPHNFYFLPGKDQHLNNNSLKLNSYLNRDAKYFRLATLSNVESFTTLVNSISGSYQHTDSTAQAIKWLTVKPYKIDGEENVWQFDLPSLVPVSAVRFTNADNIVYYQGQILSEWHNNPQVGNDKARRRGKKKLKEAIKNAANGKSRKTKSSASWRTVTGFSRYKLRLEDGSFESPDVRFSNFKSRSWKIKFNVPAELNADQLPTVEFGWKPSELNFIAQGKGPFTLFAGRDHATKKMRFPTQLQNLDVATEKVTLLRSVESGNAKSSFPELESTGSSDPNWGKILLWALLLTGVSLMLYMAYTLMRTMSKQADD